MLLLSCFCSGFGCLYSFLLPISPWKGSHRIGSSGVGLYLNLPLCEQSTRVFLSGIPKKEKKRNTLNGGGGGLVGVNPNSSFSLEITLTFSKTQEVLGLENYPQL